MKKIKIFVPFMLIFMLCLTACVKPTPESSVIESETSIAEPFTIAGTEWNLTEDNSYIIFNNDETYIWALHEEILDDNRFCGTYEFYRGEEALAEIRTYGANFENEVNEFIAQNEEYSVDDFVFITLRHETIIIDGEELLERSVIAPFCGMLLENDTVLYLLSVLEDMYYTFEKQV
jgi:hypothetical protein